MRTIFFVHCRQIARLSLLLLVDLCNRINSCTCDTIFEVTRHRSMFNRNARQAYAATQHCNLQTAVGVATWATLFKNFASAPAEYKANCTQAETGEIHFTRAERRIAVYTQRFATNPD